MKKLTKYRSFLPYLLTILDALFWIIYIIFNVFYNKSVDWIAYNDALKINPDVEIILFYNSSSYVLLFIGFLFMALAIAFSIYMMAEWFKYILYRVDKRMDSKYEQQ